MSSDTKAAIERVGPRCDRCNRIPTEVTGRALNQGYCLPCWDYRTTKQVKAAERAVERIRALQRGEWDAEGDSHTSTQTSLSCL